MNEKFVIYQYDDNGKLISTTTLRWFKPKSSDDYTFDVYAGFKVSPDARSIKLERERFWVDNWGIHPIYNYNSRIHIYVPFCGNDFFHYHKTNNMIYLCITFCGDRSFYEYHYGTLKHIDKSKAKASDEHLPALNISDIPREYRDALL